MIPSCRIERPAHCGTISAGFMAIIVYSNANHPSARPLNINLGRSWECPLHRPKGFSAATNNCRRVRTRLAARGNAPRDRMISEWKTLSYLKSLPNIPGEGCRGGEDRPLGVYPTSSSYIAPGFSRISAAFILKSRMDQGVRRC